MRHSFLPHSNTKQIILAMLMYTDDHDDTIPPYPEMGMSNG